MFSSKWPKILTFCSQKLKNSTDGNDRVVFTVPAEMRGELPKILRKGIKEIINYLKEEGYSL